MSGEERRQAPRAMVPLDGEWLTSLGRRVGRIADISMGGCFVESIAMPSVGEEVSIKVALPGAQILDVLGEVAYTLNGFGFGVQFFALTPEQHELLGEAMRGLLG